MDKARYLEFATKCLRAAEQTADPSTKLLFLEMAMAWRRLAKQAEKNSRLDVVYETPQRRPGHSHSSATTITDTWMFGAVRDHLANQVQGSYAPRVNVKALVGEVVIHPEAKQSFREEIAAVCKKHALPEPRLSGLA
jgi:hypothetical protein